MNDNNYTAGQIREMLDLSRSAVRYYIRKGLISVKKNEENGYQFFNQKNLSDLRDISYLHNILGLGIKDIQNCFNATSPKEYETILTVKSMEEEEEIRKLQVQLKRVKKWKYYMDYMKKYPNSIQIVEFPQPFMFSQLCPMEHVGIPLLCSSFNSDGQSVVFNSYGYCLDELDADVIGEVEGIHYHYPAGEYIYSMFSSALEMNNPALIEPILNWAEEHGKSVKYPILVDYFFSTRSEEQYCYYYAITVPLEECDIQVEITKGRNYE